MRKFIAMLLALALVTPFSIGCGDKKDAKKKEGDDKTKTTITTDTDPPGDADKKTTITTDTDPDDSK